MSWDFILEFPFPNSVYNPLLARDQVSMPIKCFVQVKATDSTSQKSIDIELSNLEKMVKQYLPSFLLIIKYADSNEPQTAYLVHIDYLLIGKILKKIRNLESKYKEVRWNKRKMRISYDDQHLLTKLSGEGLQDSIQKYIPPEEFDNYAKNKIEYIRKVGFENGSGEVRFFLDSSQSVDDLFDFYLKIRDRLLINNIRLTPNRFEIPDKHREIKIDQGELRSDPVIMPSQIIFRAYEGDRGITLSAKRYVLPPIMQNFPIEHWKMRLKTSFFDFQLYASKAQLKIKINLDCSKQSSLNDLISHMKALSLLHRNNRESIIEFRSQEACVPLKGVEVKAKDIIEFQEYESLIKTFMQIEWICREFDVPQENVLSSIQEIQDASKEIDDFFRTMNQNFSTIVVKFRQNQDFFEEESCRISRFLCLEIDQYTVGRAVSHVGKITWIDRIKGKLNIQKTFFGKKLFLDNYQKFDEVIFQKEMEILEEEIDQLLHKNS